MAEIQSVTFSQNQSLSLTRSASASYARSERAVGLSASIGVGEEGSPQDGFGRIFDVIDISDDARRQLLQNRADAEALSAFVRGERPQVLKNPLVIDGGRIRVDAAAAEAIERFSFTEEYELSFLQESTLEIETDEGSISITQSRLVEVSLAASVTFESSASFGSLQASLAA